MEIHLIRNVSRETYDLLCTYISLLEKWNASINLISKGTMSDIVNRHINDSLQLLEFDLDIQNWLDIGSGGGLPAIPIAISLRDEQRFNVTLFESDARKCAFLKTVSRELDLSISVINSRIEDREKHNATVITSRALAPLNKLIEFTDKHLAINGTALFLKGEKWKEEVEDAKKTWNFDYECFTSKIDKNGVVLKIRDVKSYGAD
jgi:16S rRNA (guanine527-N7)-methyltransferase